MYEKEFLEDNLAQNKEWARQIKVKLNAKNLGGKQKTDLEMALADAERNIAFATKELGEK